MSKNKRPHRIAGAALLNLNLNYNQTSSKYSDLNLSAKHFTENYLLVEIIPSASFGTFAFFNLSSC